MLRARFSEITPRAVRAACENLTEPDQRVSDAVDVRQELDLRIGEPPVNSWAPMWHTGCWVTELRMTFVCKYVQLALILRSTTFSFLLPSSLTF